MALPKKIKDASPTREKRIRCPSHLKWVREHHCIVSGCESIPIEAAHVRQGLPNGQQGGMGMKPGDNWAVSLCQKHHAEQHRIGERPFEELYHVDLREMAQEFARKSPHRKKLGL